MSWAVRIASAMLEAPEWPAAYEEYRGGVVIMQPHNATKSTVDAVRRALDVNVLMYFDATDLKVSSLCTVTFYANLAHNWTRSP